MRVFHRIWSFTLTEMLVVLAISSIVVGLAYAVLGLLSQNMHAINTNYATQTEIRLLEDQLRIDFERFHQIAYNATTEELKLRTPVDSIIYSFDSGRILREEDTLYNRYFVLKKFYNGIETSQGPVDAVKIMFDSLHGPIAPVFVDQKPDAFKYLTNHGN